MELSMIYIQEENTLYINTICGSGAKYQCKPNEVGHFVQKYYNNYVFESDTDD